MLLFQGVGTVNDKLMMIYSVSHNHGSVENDCFFW